MLIKLAALGALGYVGYRYYEKNVRSERNEAFAENQAGGSNYQQIRDSGPGAMADKPKKETWDSVDEEMDESFPASDPPANY
ncbi:hypothetical protein [Aurantiacibacter poecillastricola]|uniref:hypothetical protein n=1 Tax=Aurantiacibacter poecillastricola TaxID=3064385 RepID=UPI00273E2AFB|nr:hypothetical protein [Aurantiacibacter sp. 219JJ12-13]MDP5260687.1 hypothetical protein [Aurantiacibacter sp. 219JJ12-13]